MSAVCVHRPEYYSEQTAKPEECAKGCTVEGFLHLAWRFYAKANGLGSYFRCISSIRWNE